ncbi:aminotransferase class V-fold PLP-dependent enzyme [Aquimarina sp. U1-2]|uniref:aminotransferase class V-fold PLP-dependent enzyme n=1 Tax=Aquimarina sp. U1-2 TaxID=2823141 RepID=UPI001AED0DA2|nr:aminotransferase class V-fold PLP-dependent enzyme [Aquimarina sp. U1-2]MBP2832429.1 aminotransferase class V-fold PLP-dependent enzyme [Aquimarina sp. U1-2]
MKNLRKEFPVATSTTYINTASSGLLYHSLVEYRQQHDQNFLTGGSTFRAQQQNFLNTVRTTISDFFGNSKGMTALTPNFSLGLNTILHGLHKSKKVLVLEHDYPSIHVAVTSKKFEVYYAKVDGRVEEHITEAIKKHKPDIFIFSLVQYSSGISVDLAYIKDLKVLYPDMLIIADGTQFCGTRAFNFATSGIDILGCSGYKWLLGGYGNGFFLFQADILKQITPEAYLEASKKAEYDSSYTNLTARFECGHLDTFNFGSLLHSLRFLSEIGVSNIEQYLGKLGEYTKNELNRLHLLDTTVLRRKTHSTIFNIKGDQKLFEYLMKHHIITSLRGPGVRISLHFFNTFEDVDRLISCLSSYS